MVLCHYGGFYFIQKLLQENRSGTGSGGITQMDFSVEEMLCGSVFSLFLYYKYGFQILVIVADFLGKS